jgi:predicted transcriptional regulator
MSKYRDRLQIIADILSIASKKSRKTKIMYQANLSYKLLCRYLIEIVDAGLISLETGDCYVLTDKGKEFLHRHVEYAKRRNSVVQGLNHINNEKIVLAKMCSNSDSAKNTLNHLKENKRQEDYE